MKDTASTARAGLAAFEVLDALDGFAALVKRTPTLDGAVPVRVAQGCAPLLEGNALGFQVVLAPGLRVRRRLGRVVVEVEGALRERLANGVAAALPRLTAQGFLPAGSAWATRLREGVAWVERSRVRVWTGLLVRARRGAWLRVSGTANRRNVLLDVCESFVADDGDLVPLVVDVVVRGDDVRLEGEVACIVPLRPGLGVAVSTLDCEPALGRAHATFYDRAYFAAKSDRVTRKYRRMVGESEGASAGEAEAEGGTAVLARVGPGEAAVGGVARFLTSRATGLVRPPAGAPTLGRVTFANPVALTASFDGHTMAVTPDARALATAAKAVERTWAATYGECAVEQDRRALWYLTKFVTPHPPGDPHFFVKPFAFVRTPPGWSSVVEGVHGDGYDVLRGVVSTDAFYATPAVFHLHLVGAPVRVPAGTPLVQVIPVPRSLLAATWTPLAFRDDLARSTA